MAIIQDAFAKIGIRESNRLIKILKRYCLSLTRNWTRADDLLQDTFKAMFSRQAKCDPPTFETALKIMMKGARNMNVDTIRREIRRRCEALDENINKRLDPTVETPEQDIERNVEDREKRRLLVEMLVAARRLELLTPREEEIFKRLATGSYEGEVVKRVRETAKTNLPVAINAEQVALQFATSKTTVRNLEKKFPELRDAVPGVDYFQPHLAGSTHKRQKQETGNFPDATDHEDCHD